MSWAEFAASSPVAPFQRASPTNSTRDSLMFQSGLAAARLVMTSFVFVASKALPATRRSAVKSLAPSMFQLPGANQGRTRVNQRAMLPVERTPIGKIAVLVLARSTGLASLASSRSPWPFTCNWAASKRVGRCVAGLIAPPASARSESCGSAQTAPLPIATRSCERSVEALALNLSATGCCQVT